MSQVGQNQQVVLISPLPVLLISFWGFASILALLEVQRLCDLEYKSTLLPDGSTCPIRHILPA